MATPTMVVDLIMDALVAHLVANMQTGVATTEKWRPTTIKKGLLQTDKVQNIIGIGVIGGSHEEINYVDGIVTLETMNNIAMHVPPREIGGGEAWWRRGYVQIEAFFIKPKFDEDEAHKTAYAVLGKVQQFITTLNCTGLVDDFGERAIKLFCPSATYFESGGPPNQFIFRGKAHWVAMTERNTL